MTLPEGINSLTPQACGLSLSHDGDIWRARICPTEKGIALAVIADATDTGKWCLLTKMDALRVAWALVMAVLFGAHP